MVGVEVRQRLGQAVAPPARTPGQRSVDVPRHDARHGPSPVEGARRAGLRAPLIGPEGRDGAHGLVGPARAVLVSAG
ncbi:hypothetical protein [Streptomyces triticirhizae]|uniref:Uncharacterized protein n=1 Tax=Streptomyces triticirhizae TaxID=2483353 RepID=A0A3M2LSX5_9ACTN|nr:hypothetical protein [Streptomyces triticirhizae]RMI39155.1 hypothetical protein EBN88_15450 [Streptomyces triticirhizae]